MATHGGLSPAAGQEWRPALVPQWRLKRKEGLTFDTVYPREWGVCFAIAMVRPHAQALDKHLCWGGEGTRKRRWWWWQCLDGMGFGVGVRVGVQSVRGPSFSCVHMRINLFGVFEVGAREKEVIGGRR